MIAQPLTHWTVTTIRRNRMNAYGNTGNAEHDRHGVSAGAGAGEQHVTGETVRHGDIDAPAGGEHVGTE